MSMATGAGNRTDDLDPELIALSRPKPAITIVTAFVAAFVCLYFLWRMLPDQLFLRASSEVIPVTAATLSKASNEDKVALDGAELDYGLAVRVRQSITDRGLRVVPVNGTNLSLWVATDGHPWNPPSLPVGSRKNVDGKAPLAIEAQYIGRLRSLGHSKLRGPIVDFFAKPQPMFIPAASAQVGAKVTSLAGDPLTLAATDTVEFEVLNPNAVDVRVVFVSKNPDAASWRKALNTALGVDIPASEIESPYGVTFRIGAQDIAKSVQAKLAAAGLQWAAEVMPIKIREKMTLQQFLDAGATLRLSDGSNLAKEAVDVLAINKVRSIPEHARVIIVGESADQYWYVTPAMVLLAILAILFAWAFWRALQHERQETRANALLADLTKKSTAASPN